MEKEARKLEANWSQLKEKTKVYKQEIGKAEFKEIDAAWDSNIDLELTKCEVDEEGLSAAIAKMLEEKGLRLWKRLLPGNAGGLKSQAMQSDSEDNESEGYESAARDNEAESEVVARP